MKDEDRPWTPTEAGSGTGLVVSDRIKSHQKEAVVHFVVLLKESSRYLEISIPAGYPDIQILGGAHGNPESATARTS